MVLGTWLEDELKKRRQRQINAAEARGRAEAEARAEERDKARAEELDKIRAEEREKARADAYRQRMEDFQKWQTWNRNREAAQAAGQEFNEPPPSSPTPDPENPRQQP